MPYYTFQVEIEGEGTITVDADNYDKAEQKARERPADVEELVVYHIGGIVSLLDTDSTLDE